MKPDESGVQDFVDRTKAKYVESGIPLEHIPQPALGRIIRIANHVLELGQKRFARVGLTPASHGILTTLRIQGEPFQLSPKALAEAHFMSSGGMSNALERLEKDGLIERLPDPNDRRGVLVTLTKKGKGLVDMTMPRAAAFQRDLFKTLEEQEVEVLEGLLRKLLVRVEAEVGL